MKSFDVYRHPAQEVYEVVKQGFAWPAVFFTPIWPFVKKLWEIGFALLGILAVLAGFDVIFEEEGSDAGLLLTFLLTTTIYVVVGVKGNDWRRRNLFRRGFKKLDTVNAANLDEAIASFERRRDGNTVEPGYKETRGRGTMKSFDVYRHPAQEGYQAVKQGFAWPAFFFPVIWSFVKKMWGLGFALLGILFAVLIAAVVVEELFALEESGGGLLLILLGYMTVWVVVGVNGNDWRRRKLFRLGFEKVDTVNAATVDAAIASFKRRKGGNTVELGHVEP